MSDVAARGDRPRPRQRGTAAGLRSGRLGLRRRLGRIGQDQAADRPPAAPDAGRRGARAHPVPHLHQGRRRRDGGAAADARSADGSRWTTRRWRGELRALRRRTVGRRRCRNARALFASVLDLPGGMRIGTIHAFCQSLLRRFPLEAALSPHFRLVDDRDAEDALTEAREDMLARCRAAAACAPRWRRWRPRIGRSVRPARRDAAARSAAAAGRAATLGDGSGGRAAPRARRHRRDGSGDHRASR